MPNTATQDPVIESPATERIATDQPPPSTPPYNPFGDARETIDMVWAAAPLIYESRDRAFRGDLTPEERLQDLHELAQKMSELLAERAVTRTTEPSAPVEQETIWALIRLLEEIVLRDRPRDAAGCAISQAKAQLAVVAGGLTMTGLGLVVGAAIGALEVYDGCIRK
ncbi:hypothetical protein GCM10009613_30650 [Pseudonocardia kongjuensis]|uniref:Uncharacterized protein n=1 Tax=Pseudonocardia kongjuensis TaxID=102227 RepID=A0ABP4IGK6_9PSEU